MTVRLIAAALLFSLLTLAASQPATLQAQEQGEKVSLADGKITLAMPKAWEKQKPASNIVEYEFSLPAAEGDSADGRLTMMGAGGSVQANIDRWKGQFAKTDAENTKIEETKIGGQVVHLVDISGSFNDARGPFVPGVVRENYRMIAAIVVTDKLGQYFIKAYGPKATMAAHSEAFHEMLKSLEVK